MSFASLVESAMPHLIIAPILLPMATAALMLLLGDTRRPLKAVVNVLSCVLGVGMGRSMSVMVARLSPLRGAPAQGRR